jgi:hypothetical protein
MNRFAKAKSHDRVHGHAAERKVQVYTLAGLAFTLESRAELFHPLDTQALGAFDRGLRESAIEYILSVLAFRVREEAEAGSVLAETLVQTRLLVPAILAVVDIMVGFGVSEVKLWIVSALGVEWDVQGLHTSFGPTRTTSPEEVSRLVLPVQASSSHRTAHAARLGHD